jgi:hypothetical protein
VLDAALYSENAVWGASVCMLPIGVSKAAKTFVVEALVTSVE